MLPVDSLCLRNITNHSNCLCGGGFESDEESDESSVDDSKDNDFIYECESNDDKDDLISEDDDNSVGPMKDITNRSK